MLAGQGAAFIAPYDNDDVIAGQGTACLEALEDAQTPDAIFATCGGGGLLSGTYLAAQLLAPRAKIFGAEPRAANDAAQSLRAGHIVRFQETPKTVADGATTLAVAERTFAYLKKLDGIIEVEENAMLYWAQWLTHLLKIPVEPTSAAAMQAAADWLATQSGPKTVIIILSGGNIAAPIHRRIWEHDYLNEIPCLVGE